MAYKLNH